MSTKKPFSGRMARLLDESGEAWYHVYNRVACNKEEMPFSDTRHSEARDKLIQILRFYAKAYECEVATYTNHGNYVLNEI